MKKMKKNEIFICFILLLGLATAIFFYLKPNEPEPIKQLTIGYPELRIALPVIIAYDQDYFAEEGLDVNLKPYVTAQPMMDAIISGKIDLGGFCALPITFGAIARSNQELLFLGGMYEDNEHPISELLVKDTLNIKSIKDLKGKKIGILPTRAYEVWIQDILRENGVEPDETIISYLKPNLQADALNNGSIDALFTNDPAATITKTKGIGFSLTNEALVPKTTGLNPFYFGSFNVRKDFATNNPELVVKIAKALDKAFAFIENNQTEAKTIMSGLNKKSNSPYLPKQFSEIITKFPNSKFIKINELKNENLDTLKTFYLKKKILPKDIPLEGLQYKY
jgi:NitT/TauT family transport system substrate-binding protein